MPLQCPNCKTMNRDTATFCNSCGSRLIVSAEQVASTGAAQRPVVGVENRAGTTVTPQRPSTLPEERVEPSFAVPKPTAPPVEQAMPGPAVPKPGIPPREQVRSATVYPPAVKPGPPRRSVWFKALVFVGIWACVGVVFTYAIDSQAPPDAVLIMSAIFGGGAFLLALPFILWAKAGYYSTMGVVAHLQGWYDHDGRLRKTLPNWVFDLRLTDRNWQPLRDRRGFLLPVVEVEFRSDRLHGSALEEGSRVILRGRLKRSRVSAREIWNLSPGADEPVQGEQEVFWGQVLGWQSRQAQDMRYPGQRSLEVWSFRLQLTRKDFGQLLRDGQGNLLPALPVEIRAQAIGGSVQDGDKVEVRGQVVRGTLYAREIRNHSAGGAALVVKGWAGIP